MTLRAPLYQYDHVAIHQGDCREILFQLPADCVHTCITSPPYFQHRDYDAPGQIGLENSLDEYVAALVDAFRAVRHVPRPDGTLWLNLGDTYNHNRTSTRDIALSMRPKAGKGLTVPELAQKQLLGIPWRVALALQSDGWFLRSEIIWHKSNPNPETARDRPWRDHETVFLFSLQPSYYYDQVAAEDGTPEGRMLRTVWSIPTVGYPKAHFATYPPELVRRCLVAGTSAEGCCMKCGAQWERRVERERVPTRPGTNNTTDPTGRSNRDRRRHVTRRRSLGWAQACSCSDVVAVRCTVLDPFSGSGTTAEVARKEGCSFIGCELNDAYITMAADRLGQARLF